MKYTNKKWKEFSKMIKNRDGYTCQKCFRGSNEVVLQVHHQCGYREGLEFWDYHSAECITLCKGCHAREHKLIEPSRGWSLLSITDLGGLDGVCERIGCGHNIRYEHEIYHPDYGYKIVGSTCVNYLTQEDQDLSKNIIKIMKDVNDSVNWYHSTTKSGKDFIFHRKKDCEVRVYDGYIQINYLRTSIPIQKWGKFITIKNKSQDVVKKLAYIAFLAFIDRGNKEIYRSIYNEIKDKQI
jgi:hypothetical protein